MAERIASRIKRIIIEEEIDLVWAILGKGLLINLVHMLISESKTPVISSVWDAPESFALNQHFDPITTKAMLRDYSDVLCKSFRISVISETMKRSYESRYGVDGIVMCHGIHPALWHGSDGCNKEAGPFVIGFAGSLYAKKEWNCLIDALDSVRGMLNGRKVIIKYIGRFPRTIARKSELVDLIGPKSFSETIEELSSANIAYFGYWFKRRYSYIALTSFPGKLSAYLAAGLPVLYHGPKDSSPVEFFSRYPVGVCCHSLSQQEILGCIKLLMTDSVLLKDIASARHAALEKELSLMTMLRQFAQLIGIDVGRLLPLQ